MPIPTDVTGIRSFLEMCSYYRTYIKDFARLCHPLYNLTKNGAVFKMEEEALGSINALKIAMANSPILCHPNFDKPFIIETDASDKGLGAVLIKRYDNKNHVIQYISRTLQESEKRWHV